MNATKRTRLRWTPVLWTLFAGAGAGLVSWCVQRQVVEAQGVETLLSHAALAALLVVALALPPGLVRLFQRHARLADLEGGIEKGGWLSPPIAFLALALGIAAGGLALYQLARNLVIENTTESLSDVAHLKQHLVEHWLGDTVGDLSTWMASPEVTLPLQAWRSTGYSNGPQREQFIEVLKRVSKNEHLLEIGLRDARSGAILLPTPGDVDETALRERTGLAARERQPLIEPFHRDVEHSSGPLVGFLVPVIEAGSPDVREVAHVGIDPDHELFPLLLQSQERATSSETLLLLRDGSGLTVIHESGSGARGPTPRRVPSTQHHYFAAGVSATQAGTLDGLDERGVPVIAHAAPIPGTPWVVIAKVDLAEALVDLDTIAMFSAALATLLLMTGSWWWVEQQGHVSAGLRHRLERARLSHRVDFLSKQASDSVFLFDDQGRLLDLNDRCLAAYGYTRPDFLDPAGEAVSALAMPEVLSRLNGQAGTLFETEHCRSDGSRVPVEVAAQVIEFEGRNGIQMVVRDISERIAAERRILALSRLHQTISAVNQAIVRGRDLESVFASVCQACVDHGRFRTAWASLVDRQGACTRPVVSAGSGGELIDTAATCAAPLEDPLDPTSIAIRERRTHVCNHIAASQIESGWREQALQAGVASAIALPLVRGDHTIGVLTVYGAEVDDFDVASVALLMEMAENLRFSIEHFEQDRQRQEAERARAESSQRLKQVSRRVVQVQEEERRRLAVELHDTAGSSLVAVQFTLAMAERSLRGTDPATSELLREGIRALADIVADVRKVCAALRPSVLDYSGLSLALETCAKNFSRHGQMSVQVTQDPSLGTLPSEMETLLYRIAQEALTNCAKHAAARNVELKLGVDDGRVIMTISDDGVGFDPAALAGYGASPGLGLLSMRERSELMGGSLTIDASPGAGTRLRVVLPFIEEDRTGPLIPAG